MEPPQPSSGQRAMSQRLDVDDVPEDVMYHIFNIFLLKKAILNCSLVSKKWRSIAFTHTFRSLSLLVRSEKYPDTSGMQISRYVQDLLQDPFFSVQHIVQHLTLKWGCQSGNDIEFDFVDFMPSFPALSSLTLKGTLYTRLPASYSHAKGSLALDKLIVTGILRSSKNDMLPHHRVEAFCDMRRFWLLEVLGTARSHLLGGEHG